VAHPIPQTYRLECIRSTIFNVAPVRIYKGKLNVFLSAGTCQQVERLKHETDLLVPELRQSIDVESAHLLVLQEIGSPGWDVEQTHDVHQSGLARP